MKVTCPQSDQGFGIIYQHAVEMMAISDNHMQSKSQSFDVLIGKARGKTK